LKVLKQFINSFASREKMLLETKVEEINLEGNTILERDLIDDKLGVLDIYVK